MHAIDVWLNFHQEVVDARLLSHLSALLSEDERRQQTRFHLADDRLRYLLTRAMVRTVLSRHAAVDPADWAFTVNAYGRPEIANPHPDARTLRFNVSHTRGLIALAVSREREVGVDVENVLERPVSTGIADRFFSPAEAAELARLPATRRQDRFFEYWTFKESYIKARGLGLTLPLGQFTFHRIPGRAPTISFAPELHDDPSSWQFAQFWPTRDHRMAVAVRRTGSDLAIDVASHLPEVDG